MKTVSKLDRAEVKMMLNYLGAPLKDQPAKTSDLRHLLESFYKSDTSKYKAAYKFIVEQTSDSVIENVVKMDDARDLISGEISIIKEGALTSIDEIYKKEGKKVLENITEAFYSAVEVESKKFNIVQHKIYKNDKEVKEIDGVVCEDFEVLLQLAQERVNTLMVGPAGCGKTHVADQIASAMDLPFASQSCSAGVSESAFTGKLLPLGEHGKFEYVESDFVRIYEGGGVFLFDEIDAADANVLVFLNQSLANGSFHCSQRIKNTLVKKHPDFIAIGAANTFGSGADSLYTGRNSLDAATLDRFRMGTVAMDYSKTVEDALINGEVLAYGRKMRELISSNNLMKIVSTRFLKDATTMKEGQKWAMERIQDMYLADWSKEEIAVIGGKIKFESIPSAPLTPEEIEECEDKKSLEEKFIKIGGQKWEKDNKKRIYFDKIIGRLNNKSFYYDLVTDDFFEWGMMTTEFSQHKDTIARKLIEAA